MKAQRLYMIIITIKLCWKWIILYTNQKQWEVIGYPNWFPKNVFNQPILFSLSPCNTFYNKNIIYNIIIMKTQDSKTLFCV
jgi:uncharacterized membrane protein YhdT